MFRNQLILFALFMFQFACESPEDTGPVPATTVDYNLVSDEFRSMFKGAFRNAESLQLASVTEFSEKQMTIKLEVENISNATSKHLEGYFGGSPVLKQRTIYPLPPSFLINDQGDMLENLEWIVDRSEVLNGIQKLYIKSLSKDIGEAQSYEDGFRLVSTFRNQVIQSEELTENDRLLLIELAAGSEALLEFIENGGGQMIQKQFANNISHPPFGRLAGCSVNWRGVWMDGVVGLVGGAVYGGYIGATAGTFTVPILGTVAGGVGGAVFGGASGFISGVTYGIASNLLTSCFRPSLVQSYATCDSAWDAFMNNQTSNLPKQCFEVSVSFK